MNGNVYLSGGMSATVELNSLVGVTLEGTGSMLASYTGTKFGYSTTIVAGPKIELLGGAVTIDLSSGLSVSSSLFLNVVSSAE